jgi:peptide-methionine (S)-S-oxide reductase
MLKSMLIVVLFVASVSWVPSKENSMAEEKKSSEGSGPQKEVATLGGGCFWCLEAVYEEMEGVGKVVSGYAGGKAKNPTYREVCDGTTGHAEVVRIEFDPRVTSYEALLDVFFTIHDPTTVDRQGADVGSQYRSVILYHDNRQKETAEKKIAALESSGKYKRPVVTEVVPLDTFYEAEEYHQDYFAKNPEAGYCQAVVAPKVLKFRELFPEKLKD